jgi:hypothetical protein
MTRKYVSRGKGYFSKASKSARSQAYALKREMHRMRNIGMHGAPKRAYNKSGKYKGKAAARLFRMLPGS